MSITVYESTNKDGSIGPIVGQITSADDLANFENYNIVSDLQLEELKALWPSIKKQNERGFMSVRFIINTAREEKRRAEKAAQRAERMAYVESHLLVHNTTIGQVLHVINCLSAGKHIAKKFNNALEAVEKNQKQGTGNWFCFQEYAQSLND